MKSRQGGTAGGAPLLDRKAVGDAGEELGRAFLEKKGYRILERNYRTRFGEIDCVARDKRDIVFVEIKLRRSAAFGMPFEAVTPAKQRRMTAASLQYLKERRLHNETVRFDVVSIEPGGKIELIKSAFTAREGYTY